MADVQITKTINVTHPPASGHNLEGGTTVTVGGRDYLEMPKGAKPISTWLVESRTWSTRASAVLDELMTLQKNASKISLGHEAPPAGVSQTDYRRRMDAKALKALSEGAGPDAVEVTLPSFTADEMEIEPAKTIMPLNIAPSTALVKVRGDALR